MKRTRRTMVAGGAAALVVWATPAGAHPGADGDPLWDHQTGWNYGFKHVDVFIEVRDSLIKLREHFGPDLESALLAMAIEEENGQAAGNILTVETEILGLDPSVRIRFARRLAKEERKPVWGDLLYEGLLRTFQEYGEPADLELVRNISGRKTKTIEPEALQAIGMKASQAIRKRSGMSPEVFAVTARGREDYPGGSETSASKGVVQWIAAGILSLVGALFLIRTRRAYRV